MKCSFRSPVAATAFICSLGVHDVAVAAGTGFIVTTSGYVVTPYHVIERATAIEVLMSAGQRFSHVAVVTTDIMNDLAVLQIRDVDIKDTVAGEPPFVAASPMLVAGQACFIVAHPTTSALGSAPRSSVCVVKGLPPAQQVEAVAPFVLRVVTSDTAASITSHNSAPVVFKVKRWKGGLGELAVSGEGLRYREMNKPVNDFSAKCQDVRRLDLWHSRGWRPMVYLEMKQRYAEGFESREQEDRNKQRQDVIRIREAIADACGILIRE